MQKLRVGVIRGGRGSSFNLSLRSGNNIIESIKQDSELELVDIWISKKGVWHRRGFEVSPERVLRQLDVVINATPSDSRENVQSICEMFSVPYTGSRRLDTALAGNKALVKEKILNNDRLKGRVKTPSYRTLRASDDIEKRLFEFFRGMLQPVIVKPLHGAAGKGVSLAHGIQEMRKAAGKAFYYSSMVLFEEYVRGREASCMVIEGYRGEDLYPSPVIEVKYDFDKREYNIPAGFSREQKRMMENAAKNIHYEFNLRHCSAVDFVVSSTGEINVIEVEPLPLLDSASRAVYALESVGSSINELVRHMIEV